MFVLDNIEEENRLELETTIRNKSQNKNTKKLPQHYLEQQKKILCCCPICYCPSSERVGYSFTYIHEEGRFIYHDVPKCASTTIRSLFFDKKVKFSMNHPEKNVKAHIFSPPQIDNNAYFQFSFVRNPWDRMVSNWKMFTTTRYGARNLLSMGNSKNLDALEDFILFSMENPNHHWQPQTLFVPDNIDFIGKVENFNEDFSIVCEKINMPQKQTKKENTTKRDQYQHYYNTKLIDLVAEIYADDIKRFDFAYDE